MSGDEMVRVEKFKIERFMALGLGRYEPIRAVEDAVDWHEVEALLEALLATGCTIALALEISRCAAASGSPTRRGGGR
jgi:hypothetical protein